ncbi:MAG: hypothetical protein ICV74_04310 [Thermoleophilia bacterium]|nr:hypothetical protein [Thermoleophilia bacterium]
MSRPAFYALRRGGWRDYVTLVHPPYTAWHLSYVVLGAALAGDVDASRLWPTLAAFFLAVGVGAHALDELKGHPLRTAVSDRVLVVLAVVSIAGAVGIGVVGAATANPWIGAFVAAGSFLVASYNLEWFGGRFHGDFWFALAWGAFPLLTAYFAAAEALSWAAVAGAAFAFASSLAQRVLSTRVRDVRRRVVRATGSVERRDGSTEPITPTTLMEPEERALRILSAAMVVLAAAFLLARL